MLSLKSYFIRMVGFLLIMGAVAFTLKEPLLVAFYNNFSLNCFIAYVFTFGTCVNFYNLFLLKQELTWLNCYDEGRDHLPGVPPPKVLAPLAIFLKENARVTALPATTARSLLISIEDRLDKKRDLVRYFIGLLVFLGLLGTFWGLSQTIGAVASVIRGLDLGSTSDISQGFKDLKTGLQSPLAGMGTAFSCSLLGLAGSLMLGFLDIQFGKAAAAFYHHIEERLIMVTKLPLESESSSGPAYNTSLLEHAIRGMNQLQELMRKHEDNRITLLKGVQGVTEKLVALTEQLALNQLLVKKVGDNQTNLQESLKEIAISLKATQSSTDETLKQHLRNIDVTSLRLLEEMVEGRARLTNDMRNEIHLLARTISSLAEGTEIEAA